MLRTKHGRLAVEVTGSPRADGGRASSNRCRNKCLLAEVQRAEPIGDEVQAFKEEGLGQLEDGWDLHPNRWESEKL